jgi:hypothetical protein
LFEYEDIKGEPQAIQVKCPYLVDARYLEKRRTICQVRPGISGNMPNDGNFLSTKWNMKNLKVVEPKSIGIY